MTRTLFFADKSVLFAGELPVGASCDVILEKGTAVSRAKILKILETNNSVAILSDDPEGAFLRFAEEFLPVEAAGGIAVNGRGEWLMIHRNGRWDLPKGHLEPYEELPDCAVREVAEETGVRCEVVRPITSTASGSSSAPRGTSCTHSTAAPLRPRPRRASTAWRGAMPPRRSFICATPSRRFVAWPAP